MSVRLHACTLFDDAVQIESSTGSVTLGFSEPTRNPWEIFHGAVLGHLALSAAAHAGVSTPKHLTIRYLRPVTADGAVPTAITSTAIGTDVGLATVELRQLRRRTCLPSLRERHEVAYGPTDSNSSPLQHVSHHQIRPDRTHSTPNEVASVLPGRTCSREAPTARPARWPDCGPTSASPDRWRSARRTDHAAPGRG